jgi:NAD(P)-dependent dehydrogenase (short-subunit alcohol dehydrogenase family)
MSAGGATDEIDELVETLSAVAPAMPAAGRLRNRVAVITGGTRGIGRGIAEAFVAEGAAVVLSGKSEDKGRQALREMGGGGDRVTFHRCDVRVQTDVEDLIDRAKADFGSVDVLVNNAGGTSGWALVHELSDEAWQEALNWNLNHAFWATRRALRYMLEKGWGRIINISSVEGKQANKPAVAHYITNKHAINGLTKAVALEYGPQGITCNAICPGAIETDIMRTAGPGAAAAAGISYEQFLQNYADDAAIKRLNTVEEVAAMAALLASDLGGGITGALLNVDGGTAQW